MPRLTFEVLSAAPSHVNPLGDRQLTLRGLHVPRVENLALTRDQHDTIDLGSNELVALDGFPSMPRLTSLLAPSNRIASLSPLLPDYLPNLTTLVLTDNSLADFASLAPVLRFPRLSFLSLVGNPVTATPHYRAVLVRQLPLLKVLDFERVTLKDTVAAANIPEPVLAAVLAAQGSLTLGSLAAADSLRSKSSEDIARLKAQIKGAKSLDEVRKLERELMDIAP